MKSPAEFSAWLASSTKRPVVLCDLAYVYEAAGPSVGTGYLRLATAPYQTQPDDAISNAGYRDSIRSVPTFSRSIDRQTLGGRAKQSIGSLELNNQDGSLDFMLDLICDGQEATFSVGDASWRRDDFVQVITGIVDTVSVPGIDRISVKLRDRGLLLNTSFVGDAIGGTGQNASLPRPIVYGNAVQIEPVLEDLATLKYRLLGPKINPLLLASGYPLQVSLFDNGLSLNQSSLWAGLTNAQLTANSATDTITLAAHGFTESDIITFQSAFDTYIFGSIGCIFGPAPQPFTFWVRNVTTNTFQLSTTRGGSVFDITSAAAFVGPIDISRWGAYDNGDGTILLAHSTVGRLTASFANNDAHWTGAPRSASECAYYIAVDRGGLPPSKFGGYHWSARPYDSLDFGVQLVVKERINVADALDKMMFAYNGFWGFNRRSELIFGRIAPDNIGVRGTGSFSDVPNLAPNVAPTFGLDNIKDGSLRFDHQLPQYRYVNFWHRMNDTVLDTVAASLTADQAALRRAKGFYYRMPTVADAGYLVTPWRWHPSMVDSPDFETAVCSLTDFTAQTVDGPWAARRRDMFLPHVEFVEFVTSLEFYELDLGDIFTLDIPRFGFAGGRTLQVMGIDLDITQLAIKLLGVWRRIPAYSVSSYA